MRGDQLRHLTQWRDSQLQILRESFGVRLQLRRGKITLQGEDRNIELCQEAVQSILEGMDKGKAYTDESFQQVCDFHLQQNPLEEASKEKTSSTRLPMVQHMTEGQELYIDKMRRHTVTFSIGPAGSGKTFLAVGMAVQHLLAGKAERIILVRPAVEAGEKLGYLPGDLNEKIRPYLLPLFDALRHFLGNTRAEHYAERNIIEIAPLAYMRGRTLSNSFLILDEAQNTTVEQMKMFLTRIGQDSKAVITGDISQIDLGRGIPSGLVHARKALTSVEGVAFAHLEADDIVRHPVVGRIVRAYEKMNEGEAKA